MVRLRDVCGDVVASRATRQDSLQPKLPEVVFRSP